MVINIKGKISSNSERKEIDRYLKKDKRFSSKAIPVLETGIPVWKMNCFGYRDDMLGLGEWAKNQIIDVVGEIHKTHWFTKELVNVDVVEQDIKKLARIAPSADLMILLGNPHGGLTAEWILRVIGGRVKRYACYGDNKMRWFTEEEVWSRMKPIVESMNNKRSKGV